MNAPQKTETAAPAPAAAATNPARKRALSAIAAAVLVAGAGYGAYAWFVGRHYESTDNAYVQGNVIQITPQVGGTVLAINADDTDFVKAGQPLVRLDPADAQVALDQAEAQLAQTVREVRTLYTNNSTLKAQIALRDADVARMQADVARAQDDVARRQPLTATGAVGKEEFNHSTTQLAAAKSALLAAQSAAQAAREQLNANQVLTEGTSVEQHPNVQRAAARVREAYLAFKRSDLPAPADGYIARRSVQVGQRVAAGAPMMSLVPLNQVWVDANFKEVQLRKLRIGQPVTLTADVYGSRVEFHGHVAGLGAGTGAAFSLLPAQNATGNWIKVVQRVPVRVALDEKELAEHPLRVGLSMEATVDVSDQDGKTLADAPRGHAVAQTAAVFDPLGDEANLQVDKIIKTNLGQPAPVARAATRPAAAKAAATGGTMAAAGSTAAISSAPAVVLPR
jgi:membrane fusion protein (multidrug efflux system)